jgi:hypothetical protein
MTKTNDEGRWIRRARNQLTKKLLSMPPEEQVPYLNRSAEELLQKHGMYIGSDRKVYYIDKQPVAN